MNQSNANLSAYIVSPRDKGKHSGIVKGPIGRVAAKILLYDTLLSQDTPDDVKSAVDGFIKKLNDAKDGSFEEDAVMANIDEFSKTTIDAYSKTTKKERNLFNKKSKEENPFN